MSATVAASTKSAAYHPTPEISACPYGTIANWPNDPPAPTMPRARLRLSGGASFATTPITTPNVVPESASPTSSPAEKSNASGVEDIAISTRPAMYARALATSTRPAPKRSAIAPANGTKAPHSRFCNAIAKANSSRVQPLAIVIGGSSRPIVWRTPMASIRMSAAQARTVRLYLIRARLLD